MTLTIEGIVNLYVRGGNRVALEELKQHRQGLLKSCRDTEAFSFDLVKKTCQLEIEVIDAGLDKLLGEVRCIVDVYNEIAIAGWAQYRRQPETPVPVSIYINRQLVGQTLADRFRNDLFKAGVGTGRHGFEFIPPEGSYRPPLVLEVQAGKSHRIELDVK